MGHRIFFIILRIDNRVTVCEYCGINVTVQFVKFKANLSFNKLLEWMADHTDA